MTSVVSAEGGFGVISLEWGVVPGFVAVVVSDLKVKAGSFPEGDGLSGSGVTPVGATVECGLGRVKEGSLMHLRLGIVHWVMFVSSLRRHLVRLDVPALRLKPKLQVYRSLEFSL